MPIQNINNDGAYTAYAKGTDAVKQNATAAKNTQAASKPTNDEELAATFEKSDVKAPVTYEKTNKLTKAQISKLESMREESLRNMVTQLLSMQAKGAKSQAPDITQVLSNIDSSEVQAEQEQASGEDFYGINAVATRIMDMAISLSGGDTSKIETLKNAVIKGFEEAGAAFGQKLPDICNKTYDEIMKRFDYWKENGSLEGYTYTASNKEE